ncbi:MAG: glucosamine-6-phosphate deaminase [Clostridia bacterium]|nr:glucosamine-6-phosphate deaminase [Clostridia bacterium]
MKIIVAADYEEMSLIGSEIIIEKLISNAGAVLGLATGSTPIGLYGRLTAAYRAGKITFRNVKTVNLDEYVGLDANDCQSYVHFMREQLFDKVDIDLKNTHLPNGVAEDLQAECGRYNRLLEDAPRDLQLLGLGANGHIGFNEPGSPFDGRTRVVNLTERTIADNSRLFNSKENVPRRAVTMGIADIMQAKSILMLASGKNKAEAVYGMVKGKVSIDCPASILQLHENAVLVADKAAASLL